jgi:hypothetical protein
MTVKLDTSPYRKLVVRITRLRKFVTMEPMAPRVIIEAEIRLIEQARDEWAQREADMLAALKQIESCLRPEDDDVAARAVRAAIAKAEAQ